MSLGLLQKVASTWVDPTLRIAYGSVKNYCLNQAVVPLNDTDRSRVLSECALLAEKSWKVAMVALAVLAVVHLMPFSSLIFGSGVGLMAAGTAGVGVAVSLLSTDLKTLIEQGLESQNSVEVDQEVAPEGLAEQRLDAMVSRTRYCSLLPSSVTHAVARFIGLIPKSPVQ